jgi:tetratricopeptide (TPR) repeat protein
MENGVARPIETLEDVQSVLSSKRASPGELIECAQVARSLNNYELRLRASERAITEASQFPRVNPLHLDKAAAHVVASIRGNVSRPGELKEYLEAARLWIVSHFGPGALEKTKNIEKLQLVISESLLLVSDKDPRCQTQLCSKLRKLDRSDLGILVAERVRKDHEENAVTLTTLGSAYTDVGQYKKAEECLKAAHRLQPKNTYTLLGLSRALSQRSKHYEAHDFAKLAFSIRPNLITARRLMASAFATEDAKSFAGAQELVRSLMNSGDDEEKISNEVIFAAAEELIEAKNYDAALQAIEQLRKKNYRCSGAKSKRWKKLMDFAKANRQLTLEQN